MDRRLTTTPNENGAYLTEILTFCERHGMSQTGFGAAARGDRSLIPNLRAGRRLRPQTRALVDAFMQTLDRGREG